MRERVIVSCDSNPCIIWKRNEVPNKKMSHIPRQPWKPRDGWHHLFLSRQKCDEENKTDTYTISTFFFFFFALYGGSFKSENEPCITVSQFCVIEYFMLKRKKFVKCGHSSSTMDVTPMKSPAKHTFLEQPPNLQNPTPIDRYWTVKTV